MMATINMEFYDALLSINVPEDKAREAAATVAAPGQVATRDDLLQMQNRLEKTISDNNKSLMFWVAAVVGIGVTLTLGVMSWLLHFYSGIPTS